MAYRLISDDITYLYYFSYTNFPLFLDNFNNVSKYICSPKIDSLSYLTIFWKSIETNSTARKVIELALPEFSGARGRKTRFHGGRKKGFSIVAVE